MKTHKPHMQHIANHLDKMHQSKPNQLKKKQETYTSNESKVQARKIKMQF